MNSPWWSGTTVYQIYPRSFQDSNRDGIGDLRGVLSRVEYLHALGVETVWLCPVYPSPQRDFGYDIADYNSVAPEYGTIEDLAALRDALHAKGMKLVLDLVLNHTSDEHPWFVQSKSSAQNAKRDWYLWQPGTKRGAPETGGRPPNNWRSAIGPSGWNYDRDSDEWYWASFLPFQPDLNYRNPAVREAMLNVVRHWLDFGIDGFRLDMIGSLFKDEHFRSNPFSVRPIPSEDNTEGFFQKPLHTTNRPETFAFMRELRSLLDSFHTPERFLVGEVFGPPALLRKYCAPDAEGRSGLHLVFLFQTLSTEFSAQAFRSLLEEFEREFPPPLVPTFAFGNHDRTRLATRLGNDHRKLRLLAALQMTVRGVPFLYYGEELGMHNLPRSLRGALDPVAERFQWVPEFLLPLLASKGILMNRDECRTPMQWDSAANAGFCAEEVTPWLPVCLDARYQNVESEQAQSNSLLAVYQRVLHTRKTHKALAFGTLELQASSPNVLAYKRVLEHEQVTVLLNFSATEMEVAVPTEHTITTLTHEGSSKTHKERCVLRAYEGVLVHKER